MTGEHKKQTFQKNLRGDISALLLIAFVFQLIWPIAALASESLSDQYEAALRNNICQVMLDESEQDTAEDDLTGVLCDWCVLMGVPQFALQSSEGAVVSHGPMLQLSGKPLGDAISNKGFNPHLSAPRAPPVSNL